MRYLVDTSALVRILRGQEDPAWWDLVAVVRRELAVHSAHRGLSVADLVVAATAIRLKLTVLHEDADFETVGRLVPELRQRRVSAGPE